MDAVEEDASAEPSLPLQLQHSSTALDSSEHLLSTASQCQTKRQSLSLHEGEDELPSSAGPDFAEDFRNIAGEFKEAVDAEVEEKKHTVVDDVAGTTEVVLGTDVGEAVKERLVAEEAGLVVKNEEREVADLANEGCEMKVTDEVGDEVAVDLANVAVEETVEDSVTLKTEEGAIGLPGSVTEETNLAGPLVDAADGVGGKVEILGVNDRAAEREVAEETNVVDMAVETTKVEEEANGGAMIDKTEEAEKKIVRTETADRVDVACTKDERTEADGAGMEDEIRDADNKVEVMEEVNVVGAVEVTAYAEEEAPRADAKEYTLDAEEIEIANEADLLEEEADDADMADYTEAAENGEAKEVANETDLLEEAENTEVVSVTDLREEEADDIVTAEEAEEIEVEEQSRSISGGKRKRGKSSKSTGRVPGRKKVEEDVCFICFDGGELFLCDRRGCPKAYHPSCVNRDEAFFRSKGKWNCGWHLCSKCEKNAYYMCYTCTFSLCKGCIKDAVILCVRRNNGFCETCMRTVMLIEQNEQGNKDVGQVDFDDKNSWEYLFKDYYMDLKQRLSITYDELTQAKNPWRGSDTLSAKQESPDELYDANNDRASHSDNLSEYVELGSSKRRKPKKRLKSCSKEGDLHSTVTVVAAKGPSADDSSEWASKELLEFVMHMQNGDKYVLSQFDVQALLLEYIKRNKLRDPHRKSQIICDARLQNLFGKHRVGHFEMLKLLESHFLLKEDSQAEDLQGSVVDTETSHLEGDVNSDSYMKVGKDKRRKTRKKGGDKGPQSNVDDYAAIDHHNINLIYLRRNLVEELLEDTEKFYYKVVGSFVRIRISGSGQKQDLYRLVQVVGTCKAAEPYKVGKRMTDILLEILNLNKTEIVSIDVISNQEFTEDECKRLRQSIKCGLINRLTVGDIQDKAMVLQAVRVKDWLETEIVRLSHLCDRASEKGRRKELRECVEKLQLLKTPEERQRRLDEIPEIHADPNMDPSYESEDDDEIDDKRKDNYMRARGTAFVRRDREMVSPRGGTISNESWSRTGNYPNINRELSKNFSNKGFSIKDDDASNASELLNDDHLLQGRDRETQLPNSWERQKPSSSFESGAKIMQPLTISDSFSSAVSEASVVPFSTGIEPPAVKINETEKIWHYQDPSGKVQGPFSMVQLRKWNNTGYFPADLKIWRTTEKQDESILLTDALAGKFKEISVVVKTPKVQMHNSTSYSGKPHLPALKGMETFHIHPQATAGAPVMVDASRNADVDIRTVVATVQNLIVSSHNSHAETQGWGSGLVPKPEMAGSVQLRGGDLHAWGGAPSQRVESNNPATVPTQPPSYDSSVSFSTGNPTGNFPTPSFPGMTTPEPWRPPTSSSQLNITPPPPPNIPGDMLVAENQNAVWGVMPGNLNISWGGALPANMNMNWMPGQVAVPGNTNPGWFASVQGPSPVNSVGWAAPGQGHPQVNANSGWLMPGLAPGSANPGWSASAENPGMGGSEQSHIGDRFPNQGDHGPHGGSKSWNRQSSFSGGGREGVAFRPAFGGQRGVCRFHENGHCKKGASCDFLHP